MLAEQREDRIGAKIAQCRQHPGHGQDEFVIGSHIEEGAQLLDRAAGHRRRQRQHSGGPAKAYRRGVNHPPAVGIDLHRPPVLVAEVEVDFAVQPADADMDNALGRIETAPWPRSR